MEQETNSGGYSRFRTCETKTECGYEGTGDFLRYRCIAIRMKFPSLNDYTRACRADRYEAAKMKKDIEKGIGFYIANLPRFTYPVHIHFHWIEKNAKRDLDNIAFAKKFILDALVKRGKLIDDSRKYVTGFTDTFEIGNEYKVIIEIIEQK